LLFTCALVIPIITWLIALAVSLFKSPFHICDRLTDGLSHALSSALLRFHARPWKHLPQSRHSFFLRVPLLLFQWFVVAWVTLTRLPLCLSGAHSRTFLFLFFTIRYTLTDPYSLCSHRYTLTVSSLVIRYTLTDPSSFVNCSPFVHRSVAGLLPLFRRLFHQSVAGLLSCSLSLTVSSQLKPFVFCDAI